ncbi:MAG: hypothetical protein R3234_13320 [Thermoanaerobaculia bacterium]|nr:hypothetical protein [Thermoanaerobaculia bacterium]
MVVQTRRSDGSERELEFLYQRVSPPLGAPTSSSGPPEEPNPDGS